MNKYKWRKFTRSDHPFWHSCKPCGQGNFLSRCGRIFRYAVAGSQEEVPTKAEGRICARCQLLRATARLKGYVPNHEPPRS